ncbi:MAG: oxygenase MpaB family protein [Actinomycetota bacterium]
MSATVRKAQNTLPADRLGRCVNVDAVIARYGEQAVRPVIDGYLTADDLALDVLDDFVDLPGALGRKMFRQALDHGIESVENPPGSMVRLFEELDRRPDWVDDEQLRRGSIAYFRAGPMVSFALTCSVIAGSEQAYGISRPVVFTGRLADNAYVRAKETTRWLVAAIRPGGMDRFSEGFKLSAQVRLLHAMVRKQCSKNQHWDWDDWGMPLCHTDGLYAISYDFTQAMVDPLIEVGVRFSDQEIEDIYALWRYIGYVMGVPGQLLHRDAAHGRELADIYLSLDPGADDECRRLVRQLIELATQEGDDAPNLDVFPKVVTTLFPPLRLRKLLYGFTRFWAGDEVADDLGVPNTWHKHLPHIAKPVMAGIEVGRRVGWIDDEKMCATTLDLLSASAAETAEETTIATPQDVVEAVANNAPTFASGRGRHGRHLTR